MGRSSRQGVSDISWSIKSGRKSHAGSGKKDKMKGYKEESWEENE